MEWRGRLVRVLAGARARKTADKGPCEISMDPFLTCIAGPLKGAKFSLIDSEVIIGRDPDVAIFLGDLLLSRKHCAILRSDTAHLIRDLDSLNGVFVNEVPVHERELHHGDQIKIGSSVFTFLEREDTSVFLEPPIQDSLRAKSTLTQKIELDGAKTSPSPAFDILLRMNLALNHSTNLEQFSEELLNLISDCIPCERAFVLQPENSTLKTLASLKKLAASEQAGISKSVCDQALRDQLAVLATDFEESDRSVICLPLMWLGRIAAIVYLDSVTSSTVFDQTHLQIGSAIVTLASPLFSHLEQTERIEKRALRLEQELSRDRYLVGESAAFQRAMALIHRVAPSDTTVLILGESGTGKELAARRMHAESSRKKGPFIAINCAAVPESLLESELFGHEKGAFTGAIAQKKGKVEAADGGVLFLDEIAELSPGLQAKLLRVLQEREVERIGSTRPVNVDIRVIAATNQDVEKAVRDGNFRQDLFYRLNVVSIRMPALKEMGDDVLLLAQYFIDRFRKKIRREVLGLSSEARDCLLQYGWPGNIRELENAMERAVVLGNTELILLEDLPEHVIESRAIAPSSNIENGLSYQDAIVQRKRELVLQAFEKSRGNYNHAASILGVHPNYLYRLVRSLKLEDAVDPRKKA